MYEERMTQRKKIWSIVESNRLNFCVEIFNFLAIIPSKISVIRPIVNKITIIVLFDSISIKENSKIIKPIKSLEKIKICGKFCFILIIDITIFLINLN